MDFFTKKELNGLKGDLKASEIALRADKEQFKKKLVEKYGKEMDSVFNAQSIPMQVEPAVCDVQDKNEEIAEEKPKKKQSFLKRLFSI